VSSGTHPESTSSLTSARSGRSGVETSPWVCQERTNPLLPWGSLRAAPTAVGTLVETTLVRGGWLVLRDTPPPPASGRVEQSAAASRHLPRPAGVVQGCWGRSGMLNPFEHVGSVRGCRCRGGLSASGRAGLSGRDDVLVCGACSARWGRANPDLLTARAPPAPDCPPPWRAGPRPASRRCRPPPPLLPPTVTPFLTSPSIPTNTSFPITMDAAASALRVSTRPPGAGDRTAFSYPRDPPQRDMHASNQSRKTTSIDPSYFSKSETLRV
jgi:hypothetical protein